MIAWALVLVLAAQDRAAVPDGAAQKEAEKIIRDIFKDDYAKKTTADRRDLAKKLLEQGVRSKDDLVSRYVLLREARDLSAGAGDVESALQAVEAIGSAFIVNVAEMKLGVLSIVEKGAKTPAEQRLLAESFLKLANQAVLSDQLEEAEKAIQSAVQNSRKAKDVPFTTRTEGRAKEISAFKSRFDRVRKAREVLASNPQDAAANAEVGSWACLVHEDWEGGIPLLAQGTDSPLKALAVRDAAAPAVAADCLSLADAWWDLSAKEPPGPKESLRKRAAFWYRKAAPGLTGLLKARAEGRAIEVLAEPGRISSWVDASDPAAFGHKGKPGESIELDGPGIGGKHVSLQKWSPGDIDGITVRMRFKSDRVAFAILTFAPKCEFTFRPEGCGAIRMTETNAPLARAEGPRGDPKDVRVATILLVDSEFIFYAEGVEIGRLKAPVEKFTMLELRALGGVVAFDRIRLRRRE